MTSSLHTRVAAGALTIAVLTSGPAMAQDTPRRVRVPIEITLELGDLSNIADLGMRGGLQDRDFQAEQTDQETRTLDLGSSGSLELRNVLGDIIVTAGSGSTATVAITRRSRGRTDEDAREGLVQVPVEITESRGRATVVARYPENRGQRQSYQVSVTYEVTAPVGTRLTVDSVSGDVTVRGIRGDVSVNLISGDIEIADATRLSKVATVSGSVTLTDIDGDESLTVTNLAGTVRLERIRASRVDVNAVSGAITASDITAGSAKMTTMAGRIVYSGPLSTQGRYEFQAHNGDIDLTVVGNSGFELRASTFSGSIEAGAGIEATGLVGSRSGQSLQGRVGEGEAVVSATSFSGSVTIRRR